MSVGWIIAPGWLAMLVRFCPTVLVAPAMVVWTMLNVATSARLEQGIEAAESAEDVPALLDLLAHLRRNNAEVAAKLRNLLPMVADFGALRMDRMHRAALRGVLRHQDAGLVLAALGAFERAGDTSDLDAVRPRSHPSCPEAVRDAAAACIAAIEWRAAQARSQAALLRPAEAPGEALLRPADGAIRDDAALLRPVQQEEEAQANEVRGG